MTKSYIVEYQSYNTTNASISLPGPLLVTSKSLKVKQKLGNRIILTQNNSASKSEENDAPDILVGSIPLIHFADDGVTPALTYLRIPPPAPFKDGDIEVMWDKIRSSGCPIPTSVASQGRYAPGSAQKTVNSRQITAEFLNYAHQQCRLLLSRWPINETSELIKRNTELGGGREDFLLTERNIGLEPIISAQENRRIPQQTFRRRSNDTRWKSNQLGNAASTIIKSIRSRTTVQIPSTEVDRYLAPFAAVAKLATTRQTAMDPPVSAWPFEARLCYESLLAAMAALKVDDQGTVPAPLSYLWRLYQAWISAVCLEVVMRRIGNPSMEGNLVLTKGCEWMARWQLPKGIYITLIAQPYISAIGLVPPLQAILPIKSITCDLKPDILLAVSSENNIRLLIIDAKKRSPRTAMDASQVTEAGSKYVLSIRTDLAPDSLIVNPAIVVSTMQPGKMHTPESPIKSIRGIPSDTEGIGNAILKELNEVLTESS